MLSGGSEKTANKEIEYRFHDIDIVDVRKKLKKRGTLAQKKIIMPLMTFTHPHDKPDSYIRIRHEGDRITMTSKTNMEDKFVTEYEVTIDNFSEGVRILKSLGCKKKYYVEKLRETWNIMNTEVVIDSYPGTPEYIEIEGKSEGDLIKVAKYFNLEKPQKKYDFYYEKYGIPSDRKISGDLTFLNGLRKFDKLITKNKKQFKKILKSQQKYYKDLDFDHAGLDT